MTPPTPNWLDKKHPVTSLTGFASDSAVFNAALPLRRHKSLNWFVPVARVGSRGDEFYALTTTPRRFRAKLDGQLFMYVNDAACRSLGYGPEELLGMRVPDIDPLIPATRWPEHWEELRRRGMLIRDCSATKGCTARMVRIAVRAKQDNDRLLAALAGLLRR